MKRSVLLLLGVFLTSGLLIAQTQRPEGLKRYPTLQNLDQPVNFSQKQAFLEQALEMRPEDDLRIVKVQQDPQGFTHQKHEQFYKGIKVDGASLTTHIKNGKIELISGHYTQIPDLNVSPTMVEPMALQQALNHVNATSYIWDTPSPAIEESQSIPQGELVIVVDAIGVRGARLAYKFDVYALEPLSRSYVYVDAETGEVLQQLHRIHDANVPASGNTLYNGTRSFTADNTSGPYRLRETIGSGGVETYNLNNGTNYGTATDFTSSNVNSWSDATGVQAHWGAEQTYEYFLNDHGRNSYNGSGGILRSYVHYSNNYVNAFWDGSRMTYGDGNGTSYGPLVSLDIAGHEIAHGVTEFSANLVYQRESGALNESFSDIFGEMVEHHAIGSNDWLMGDDIGIGGSGALRSMSNPNQFGDPDTYGGTNWTNPQCGTPTQSNDYCGVHSNSGVQNRWFYVLAIGASGTNDIGNSYSVTGIGRTKAAAIAYRNLTVYLSTSSTFADARAGAIQSAVDLYGAGSAEEIATTNAWYSVGVGGEYGTISYCSSNGNNVSDEYISRVQLNTINNVSGAQGYSNFTSISTSLTKGTGYTITVTPTWTGTVYNEAYSVWIDYNADGDFSDAGEQVWTQGNTTASSVSGSFTVPTSATDGPTRMRVSMKYNGIPTACESFSYGEVEDYTVDIGGGAPDTQAPSNPTSLAASNVQETTLSLNWNASTDNVGVTGYNVFQGTTNLGTVTGTSANITGLTAATAYSFYVTAFDAAGNVSGASNTVSVTTDSPPTGDTQAPTSPTNLTASNTTQTTTDLSWTASSDNVGVTGYNVFQGTTNLGTVTGTSANITGLTAATAYTFYVTAFDAAGNVSGASNTVNVTTQSGGGGGTTTISGTSFETGWDDWNDGGSDCGRTASSARSYDGNYSIYIRDNSGTASSMTSDPFALSGYVSADVEFYFYAYSMETGEDFWLQYNNGSGWQTVATWVSGSSFTNNSFWTTTVSISAGDVGGFSSNSQFRFRCDASTNSDIIYIDLVTITATSSTVAGVVPASSVTTSWVADGPAEYGLNAGTEFEGDLLIYPSPAQSQLTIQAADPIEMIEIYTVSGQLVGRQSNASEMIQLNLGDLSAGVYMITVRTTEEVFHEKFVKE